MKHRETHHDHDIYDLAHKISFLHRDERSEFFLRLSEQTQFAVFTHLTKHVRKELITTIPDSNLVALLERMDPDDATDTIQLLNPKKQKNIIAQFNDTLKESVGLLNQFDPQTAAGLMNVDYIQVTEDMTIVDVVDRFRIHERKTGRLPIIIVLTTKGKILGELPGYQLGLASPQDLVKDHTHEIKTLPHNIGHDEVIEFFKEYPHHRVAVLGKKKSVIGIIYSDDVLRLIQEESSSSLYDFAGVSDEESVTDPAGKKINNRYKWLIINLATAFLASFTVGLFNETISKYVLLAVYMPIVAGMGGNAATQTLAVLVRGIAMKQIDLNHAWGTLKNELGAGFVNGIINGLLVAAVVIIVNHDFRLAFVLSIAMIVNLLVASFFGTMVPLIMKRFGKDPATSATIFITTATDVLGFLAFLGLATVILR